MAALVLLGLAGCRALLSLDDLERVACVDCEDAAFDATKEMEAGDPPDAATDQRPPTDAAPIVCPQPKQSPQRFPTDLPDLIVVSASADPKAAPKAGQPFTLIADVKNIGTQTTPDLVLGVAFFSGPGATPLTYSDTFVQPLVAGATARLYSNAPGLTLADAGTYAFAAVVDDIDRICDIDETNQKLEFQVVVAP